MRECCVTAWLGLFTSWRCFVALARHVLYINSDADTNANNKANTNTSTYANNNTDTYCNHTNPDERLYTYTYAHDHAEHVGSKA